ncbi:hypothetical protein [Shewanella insulae]|uniref:hypothetical protein n=1 Tax=Shewanella insulae TaxID=2681496 RepID=UPI0024803F5A|nr:hypothetical protein [Shewanella insulae]
MLSNFAIITQSAQTAYFIILIATFFVVAINSKKIRYLISLVFLFAFILIVNHFSPDGSWIALKSNQIVNLFTLDVSAILLVNSLAIRLYSFVNIFLSSNLAELMFGSGLGAIYYDVGNFFNSQNVHAATFPLSEISSGEFHTVHESIFRLFFHCGLVGIFFFFFLFFKKIFKEYEVPILFSYLYFIFLWLSSIQTVFFLTIFLVLISCKTIKVVNE